MGLIPAYRVWAGFAIWIGATVLDFLWLTQTHPDAAGFLSLTGFSVALLWAVYGPDSG